MTPTLLYWLFLTRLIWILSLEEVVKTIGKPAAIIDCFGILSDEKIRKYFRLGCGSQRTWPRSYSEDKGRGQKNEFRYEPQGSISEFRYPTSKRIFLLFSHNLEL